MEVDADGNELECRVCRSGAEDGRPLYFPCRCSGSIGAVHQDCLEAWLQHKQSHKDTCELCLSSYEFAPQYAENAPDSVPALVLLRTILRMGVLQALPQVARVLLVVGVWLVLVPLATACLYCLYLGRKGLSLDVGWEGVLQFVVHGLSIDAVMGLSLLVLVSFADFLRFHWAPRPHDVV
jgi:E3 ubiquitin-protein ligase MARCH6